MEVAINSIKQELIGQSISKIRIRHYPTLYSPTSQSKIGQLLTSAGFEIVQSHLNHHLETNREYEPQLHSMEKRKLQVMLSMAPSFRQENLNQLPLIYEFILSCRMERRQTMSLKLSELQKMVEQFPAHYLLFTARIEEELAAATICVIVSRRIMYNFYPAFKKKFNRISPLVYLIGEIHGFCRSQGIAFLDLGTSQGYGKLNTRLSRFKDRLGASTSLKYTFEWSSETSA